MSVTLPFVLSLIVTTGILFTALMLLFYCFTILLNICYNHYNISKRLDSQNEIPLVAYNGIIA